MQKITIQKPLQVVLFLFLLIAGLYYAKPFLVPVCFGGLFAMLFLPLSRWFERRGMNRAFAILLCVLIFVAIITGIIWLIAWQVSDLTSDIGNMEQKVKAMVSQLTDLVSKNFGVSPEQQDKMIQDQSAGTGGMLSNMASSFMGMLVDFILVLVYIFLFMYFRQHIKKFVLQLVPAGTDKKNAQQIIHDIQKVAQQYLTGLGLMIVCLWIMYSIGFSIVGLKNAFFFAVLCGLLEIVPFVGNLTGNAIAVLMAFTQGGGIAMVLGILITYATVQFLQTYLLEPLVVGAEVNINPLATIIVLVVGELVWGIPGMVLAIPLLGIAKIVCDHVEPLKPYGFLVGQEKKKKTGILDKLRARFK